MVPVIKNNSTFYKNHENVNGKIFSLYWENPENLSLKFKQQIKKLFIGFFLAQYLDDPSPAKQIENDLEDYFIKSVEPLFINNSKQYLLCASINKNL
ncbi:MAG: hypothetical protein ACR2HS_00310 [Gammaproteobacteria bacterium]